MTIYLKNTLTGQKEEFKSIRKEPRRNIPLRPDGIFKTASRKHQRFYLL
jgi:hypothetical protein